MAYITQYKKTLGNRNNPYTYTIATYEIIKKNGNKVIVLKTFGRNGTKGNTQTLHFDCHNAIKLIDIFKTELDI